MLDDIEVVGEAENGLTAVAQAVALRPDVALLDITMPELDGLAATARIRRQAPQVKVLVLTMHDYGAICALRVLMRDGAPCSGPGLLKCNACAGRASGAVRGAVLATGLRAARPALGAIDALIAVSGAVARACSSLRQPIEVVPNFLRPGAQPAVDVKLSQLIDEVALDFLPRRLMGRILIAASLFQRLAAFRELAL